MGRGVLLKYAVCCLRLGPAKLQSIRPRMWGALASLQFFALILAVRVWPNALGAESKKLRESLFGKLSSAVASSTFYAVLAAQTWHQQRLQSKDTVFTCQRFRS